MPPTISGRKLALAAIAILTCSAAAAQENLDAGKSAPKLFALRKQFWRGLAGIEIFLRRGRAAGQNGDGGKRELAPGNCWRHRKSLGGSRLVAPKLKRRGMAKSGLRPG